MALTPYQQQRRARIMALPPERQAILGFAVNQDEEQAAGENARRDLTLERLGAAKDATDRRLDLDEERLNLRGDLQRAGAALQRRGMADEIKQNKRAETLGWGNLGVSGVLGFGQMKQDEERARQLGAFASLYA